MSSMQGESAVLSFTVLRRAVRPSLVAAGAGLLLISAAPAHAATLGLTPTTGAWGTNGRVTEILPVGNGRVAIAGTFTALTDPVGGSHPAAHLAVLDASGVQVPDWSAGTDGEVDALAMLDN